MADAKFVAIETSALMELPEVISTDQATVRVPLKITISPESIRILPHLRVKYSRTRIILQPSTASDAWLPGYAWGVAAH